MKQLKKLLKTKRLISYFVSIYVAVMGRKMKEDRTKRENVKIKLHIFSE